MPTTHTSDQKSPRPATAGIFDIAGVSAGGLIAPCAKKTKTPVTKAKTVKKPATTAKKSKVDAKGPKAKTRADKEPAESKTPTITIIEELVWLLVPLDARASNKGRRYEWDLECGGVSIPVVLIASTTLAPGRHVAAQVRVVAEKVDGKARMRIAAGWDYIGPANAAKYRRVCLFDFGELSDLAADAIERQVAEGSSLQFKVPKTKEHYLVFGPVGCSINP